MKRWQALEKIVEVKEEILMDLITCIVIQILAIFVGVMVFSLFAVFMKNIAIPVVICGIMAGIASVKIIKIGEKKITARMQKLYNYEYLCLFTSRMGREKEEENFDAEYQHIPRVD